MLKTQLDRLKDWVVLKIIPSEGVTLFKGKVYKYTGGVCKSILGMLKYRLWHIVKKRKTE